MPADKIFARRAANAVPNMHRMRNYWWREWEEIPECQRAIYPARERPSRPSRPAQQLDHPQQSDHSRQQKTKKMKSLPDAWRLIDVSDIMHDQEMLRRAFENYFIDGQPDSRTRMRIAKASSPFPCSRLSIVSLADMIFALSRSRSWPSKESTNSQSNTSMSACPMGACSNQII
eukprot:SAG31_NODE_3064_length_4732_cov_4.692833_5_plen_174_part_00